MTDTALMTMHFTSEPDPVSTSPRWAALRFVGVFTVIFAALQFGLLRSEGTGMEQLLIDRATVGVAASLAGWVFAADEVRAQGPAIISSRVQLNVLRGCEGTDAIFLAIAAALAFPASWRSRLLALSVGVTLAYGLNQLRILALYYTIRDAREHFELVHAYLAPTVLIVALAVFFWWWTHAPRPRGRGT